MIQPSHITDYPGAMNSFKNPFNAETFISQALIKIFIYIIISGGKNSFKVND